MKSKQTGAVEAVAWCRRDDTAIVSWSGRYVFGVQVIGDVLYVDVKSEFGRLYEDETS